MNLPKKLNIFRKNAWKIIDNTNEEECVEALKRNLKDPFYDIKKFKAQDTAPDANMIAAEYGFPISLASGILEDLMEIVQLGVMSAPSMMIDGKLVVSGRVPSVKTLTGILEAQKRR